MTKLLKNLSIDENVNNIYFKLLILIIVNIVNFLEICTSGYSLAICNLR